MDGWVDRRKKTRMDECIHACKGSVRPSWALVREGFRDWTWTELVERAQSGGSLRCAAEDP